MQKDSNKENEPGTLEPLAQELVAPCVPAGIRGSSVGTSCSATPIVLHSFVSLSTVSVLISALLGRGRVGIALAGSAAGIRIAQAPRVLGLAGILASVGDGVFVVGGACAEFLAVEELEGILGALLGVIVAADAGELVVSDCVGSGPFAGDGTHARGCWCRDGGCRAGCCGWWWWRFVCVCGDCAGCCLAHW